MTYKKIVEGMVERSAKEWLEELLEKNNIEAWVFSDDVNLEKDKFWHLFEVGFTIHEKDSYRSWRVSVGGTVDDGGVCNSVIWQHKDDEKKEIWCAVEKTRIFFGIKEFKLA